MLAKIALFEWRYQLRRPLSIVAFLVLAALAYGVVAALASNSSIPVHSPWLVTVIFAFFTIFGMFLSLAMLADVALRDQTSRMDEIIRTMPVRNWSYLGAKFA